jgi:hypothetical protein
METQKLEIKESIEEIINRLEEVRNDAMEVREAREMGVHEDNFANEEADESELLESALFEAESCIDEMTQALMEEIDNLKALSEGIDDL